MTPRPDPPMSAHTPGLIREVIGGMTTYRCPECGEGVRHEAEDIQSSPCLLHAAALEMLARLRDLVDQGERDVPAHACPGFDCATCARPNTESAHALLARIDGAA